MNRLIYYTDSFKYMGYAVRCSNEVKHWLISGNVIKVNGKYYKLDSSNTLTVIANSLRIKTLNTVQKINTINSHI